MVACQECGTTSPLDSKFCKHCGTALSDEARSEASEHVKQMIEEGNQLFTEGRTDEALMVAEAAAQADPNNALAQSLKGLCLERTGQLAAALEAYEKAAALNPSGTLDKIKVQSLRLRLTQSTLAAEAAASTPDRRRALTFAAAAVVLMAGLGALLAVTLGGKNEKLAKNDTPVNGALGFTNNPVTDASSATPQNPSTQNSDSPKTGDNGGRVDPGTGDTGKRIVLPTYTGQTLPDPNVPVGPLVLERDPTTASPNKGTGVPSPGLDPNPTDDGSGNSRQPNPGTTNPTPPAPAAQEDKGFIDIQVSPRGGGRPNQPGAQPLQGGSGIDSNGLEALRRSAQNQFELGHYTQAAAAYDKLARAGGNSPKIQQRLGQCYENLGNNQAAAKSFNTAVSLYQSEIKAGRNVDANRLGLAATLQALKVVGGG